MWQSLCFKARQVTVEELPKQLIWTLNNALLARHKLIIVPGRVIIDHHFHQFRVFAN